MRMTIIWNECGIMNLFVIRETDSTFVIRNSHIRHFTTKCFTFVMSNDQ